MMKWILDSMDKAPSFQHYQEHIHCIIENIHKNPMLSIETSKSVIEGVCKTILNDKGKPIPNNFPNLTSAALDALNVDYHPDKNHIIALIKKLKGILHYIAEIRNNSSFATHGQDIEHPKLSSDLALFVAHSTNAVLGFILHFYIVSGDYQKSERIRYEDYPEFNRFLDDYFEQETGSLMLKISYSKALFNQDKIAYCDELENFKDLENLRLQETL
ncbi:MULTISPECIES: abortive infection family protein [Pasteurellaceae]|uniref:abortive infection family protein n=1 Tax=Pasteurellaceae TaxID=712 RepID=UPI003561958A